MIAREEAILGWDVSSEPSRTVISVWYRGEVIGCADFADPDAVERLRVRAEQRLGHLVPDLLSVIFTGESEK